MHTLEKAFPNESLLSNPIPRSVCASAAGGCAPLNRPVVFELKPVLILRVCEVGGTEPGPIVFILARLLCLSKSAPPNGSSSASSKTVGSPNVVRPPAPAEAGGCCLAMGEVGKKYEKMGEVDVEGDDWLAMVGLALKGVSGVWRGGDADEARLEVDMARWRGWRMSMGWAGAASSSWGAMAAGEEI